MVIQDLDELFQMMKRRNQGDTYEWREGLGDERIKKADPNVVGNYLERIAQENGGALTTALLVEDSDNPNSPLYRMVERDIEIAAMKHRQSEVRSIAGALILVKQVKTDKGKPETIRVRALHNVVVDGVRSYAHTYVVSSVTDLQDQAKDKLMSQAVGWANRAKHFEVFAGAVAAIEQIAPTQMDKR